MVFSNIEQDIGRNLNLVPEETLLNKKAVVKLAILNSRAISV